MCVVACGLTGAGTVSEVALALKAGKPVILVGATPAEAKFFKNLGGRLIAAVESPEEAITLMMKQFEQRQPDLVQGARSWGASDSMSKSPAALFSRDTAPAPSRRRSHP